MATIEVPDDIYKGFINFLNDAQHQYAEEEIEDDVSYLKDVILFIEKFLEKEKEQLWGKKIKERFANNSDREKSYKLLEEIFGKKGGNDGKVCK